VLAADGSEVVADYEAETTIEAGAIRNRHQISYTHASEDNYRVDDSSDRYYPD